MRAANSKAHSLYSHERKLCALQTDWALGPSGYVVFISCSGIS